MNKQLCQTSLALATYAMLGLAMSQPVTAAPLYSVTEIVGDFNYNDFTDVNAINNKGEIVFDSGIATADNAAFQAYLYSDGKLQDIGSLGNPINVPSDINDKGQVAGFSSYYNWTNYSFSSRAFLYSLGKMLDIGSLGGDYNVANGINNKGQVVGFSGTRTVANGDSGRAFLYSRGKLQDLGSLGGSNNVATAINNNSQVVGYSGTSNLSSSRAFLYSDGNLQDLGSLGGSVNVARGINDKGQVVGYSGSRAFLYSDGKLKDLGSFGGISDALGINNKGQVVGYSYTSSGEYSPHAFLYSNNKLQDLNSLIPPKSKVTLQSAVGINDNGQIAATGSINNDSATHVFLLTPKP